MKKFFFLVIAVISFISSKSQAVGIGTNTPEASSLLDISSTTKGMLMPRMTSAQRTAIASPATGLVLFDTDTKTLWAYDGTAWKNLYTSGGVLTLPFSQTVNTAISAFHVTNQGTGAAIEGSSTAQFGIGMTAKTTGEGGWGLFAFSNGAGSQSVRSYADNGTAYHGENNNPANTNTLLNLINRGSGKTGSFQLVNNSSTSFNVQIAGNNLGEQLKIYQTNALNTVPAVSIENSGTGVGLYSVANNGNGIKGVTNTSNSGSAAVYGENNGTQGNGVFGVANFASGYGVKGESNSGTGILGYSGSYRGVSGSTISGTALYGTSSTGYGLEVNGKVKISGGNTNPSTGAVLTSDASGNATWQPLPPQPPKIGFRGEGSNLNFNGSWPVNNYYKVIFNSENYDFGNDFTPYSGSLPYADASLFTVPVNGVYNFSSKLFVIVNGVEDNDDVFSDIRFGITRNGNTFYVENDPHYLIRYNPSDPPQALIDLKISYECYLYAGDKVFVSFRHSNSENAPAVIANYNDLTYFHGRLVIPD